MTDFDAQTIYFNQLIARVDKLEQDVAQLQRQASRPRPPDFVKPPVAPPMPLEPTPPPPADQPIPDVPTARTGRMRP